MAPVIVAPAVIFPENEAFPSPSSLKLVLSTINLLDVNVTLSDSKERADEISPLLTFSSIFSAVCLMDDSALDKRLTVDDICSAVTLN